MLTLWGRTDAGRPLIVAARRQDSWTWLIIGFLCMFALHFVIDRDMGPVAAI
ncbi:hypothetical protein [Nocardia wallacei]|uniref:hypothetical protein n=1 Tax=Nocardia wallacei TaxID=480035 RepID=UPI002457C2B6|nr:hypothetical protein [Nocardia wallacei]